MKYDPKKHPPAVTFQTGAQLLVDLGIVEHMTHQGIRWVAEHDPSWPFGPGREYAYWRIGNASAMATGPFLEFFQEREQKAEATP